jgi:hypothetical protein
MSNKICKVEGCIRTPKRKNYCDRHYQKYMKYGDPLAGRSVEFGLSNEQRFYNGIIKRDNGCWEWQGAISTCGYAQFAELINETDKRRRYKTARVHNWAYRNFKGNIPEGFEVCHKCDNTICVNPEHLFIGTHLDNMSDSSKKGRQGVNKADSNGRSKLTSEIVEIIRNKTIWHHGERSRLAREFGVTPATISKLLKGDTWK